MSNPTPIRLSLVVCVFVLANCTQQAAPPADPHERVPMPESEAPAVSGTSVRAVVDPVTGQLREPTPEEEQALAAAEAAHQKSVGATRKTTETREITLPSGAVMVPLDESTQQPLRGCIGQDGDVKMDHECDAEAKK